MAQRSAFTLVELSIVIVIIGLLVGGVVAGQSLLEQARLRKVTSQLQQINTALNVFLLQYNYLPGDIPNAFDYWGSIFDCLDELALVNSEGCNGDGNRLIMNRDTAGNDWQEGYRAWQQLGYLGLIDGQYNGNYNAGFDCRPGENTPKIYDTGGMDFGASALGGDKALQIGRPIDNCYGSLFIPSVARQLDTKIDDSMPTTGKFRAPADASCLNGTEYDLTQTVRRCRIHYYAY